MIERKCKCKTTFLKIFLSYNVHKNGQFRIIASQFIIYSLRCKLSKISLNIVFDIIRLSANLPNQIHILQTKLQYNNKNSDTAECLESRLYIRATYLKFLQTGTKQGVKVNILPSYNLVTMFCVPASHPSSLHCGPAWLNIQGTGSPDEYSLKAY